MTSYYKEAAMSGLILQFAFTYTDNNRQKMKDFKEMLQLANYLKKQNTVEQFATYADQRGLKRRNLLIRRSHQLLEKYIDARIIYNMLDEQALNEYLNQDAPCVTTALRVFARNAAFPKKPLPAKPAAKKPAAKKPTAKKPARRATH